MNAQHRNSDINKTTNFDHYPDWLSRFITVYEQLATDNLELINTIYAEKIHFQDPMHELNGIDALHRYFDGLYKNLSYCNFKIQHVIHNAEQAAVYWEMTYQHKKLNKGKEVKINGSSHLVSDHHKIISHRDYLDLGAMLYEQLPVLGKLISWIKTRAAN